MARAPVGFFNRPAIRRGVSDLASVFLPPPGSQASAARDALSLAKAEQLRQREDARVQAAGYLGALRPGAEGGLDPAFAGTLASLFTRGDIDPDMLRMLQLQPDFGEETRGRIFQAGGGQPGAIVEGRRLFTPEAIQEAQFESAGRDLTHALAIADVQQTGQTARQGMAIEARRPLVEAQTEAAQALTGQRERGRSLDVKSPAVRAFDELGERMGLKIPADQYLDMSARIEAMAPEIGPHAAIREVMTEDGLIGEDEESQGAFQAVLDGILSGIQGAAQGIANIFDEPSVEATPEPLPREQLFGTGAPPGAPRPSGPGPQAGDVRTIQLPDGTKIEARYRGHGRPLDDMASWEPMR